MKQLILKTLLSATTLSIANAGVAAPVAVPNGSFETGNGATLSSWQVSNEDGSQGTWQHDSSVARNGQSSLLLHKVNHSGYLSLLSSSIPVQPNTQYQACTRLRMPETAGANVYYMIRQQKRETDATRAPNISSPILPFYGTNGEWEELTWTFQTADDVQSIQIGIIFAQAPFQISVDDIELKSISKEEYQPRFSPPTRETLLARAEVEKILQTRAVATAQVKTVGARPRLFINDKPSIPFFYKGPVPWKFQTSAQIRDFADAGVNVYLIPAFLGRGVYQNSPSGVWLSKGQTDFREITALMWRVLQADPHGYIMFDLQTDPYPEWGTEHPDDVVINEKGEKAIAGGHALRFGGEPQKTTGSYAERYGYSYVSNQLRQDVSEVLQQLDAHIKSTLPGKALIGYFLGGGDDGQMFAWGDRSDQVTDYSKASLFAFRGWLKAKYQVDSALQKAWRMPHVTLDTAPLPTAARRLGSAYFLDPQTEQDIIDYRRFHSEGTIDTKNIYAATLRKAHQSPIIIGSYYAGPTIGITSHRATEYLLKGGQYDILTSVLAYGATRSLGGPGKAHQAWNSFPLHNAIALAEEDYRSWKSVPTTLARDEQLVSRVQTAEESNAMLRRDTGRMLANGNGVWWYDMEGGWFNDPSIMKAVRESTIAARGDLNNDALPKADVAVFVDEYSLDTVSHHHTRAHRNSISQQIIEMKSSGVPYHTYLQNDVSNPNLPQYKMYVFLDAYHLEPATWQAIQKLRRDGKMLVFMHAPGVVSRDLLQVDSMQEAIRKVTGIIVQANGEQSVALLPAKQDFHGNQGTISFSRIKAPTFTVTDAQATPLANYKEGGKTAVAKRDFGTWKSLFFGGMGMDAFFFNALAREAGAWVAGSAGDAVYANQNFLTIHAMHSGEKNLRLLEPSKVTDLTDGKLISPQTQTLNLSMQRGETRWFRLEKP